MARLNISLLATLSLSIFLASTPVSAAPSRSILTTRDIEGCGGTRACEIMNAGGTSCNQAVTGPNSHPDNNPSFECQCEIARTEYPNYWDDVRYCVGCVAAQDPSYNSAYEELLRAEEICQDVYKNNAEWQSRSGSSKTSDEKQEENEVEDNDDTNSKKNTGNTTVKKNSGTSIKVKTGFILAPAIMGLNFVL